MKNVCFPFDKFYERYGNPVTDGIADTDLFQNKPEMIAVLNHKRRRLLRWHNKFSKELGAFYQLFSTDGGRRGLA